MDAINTHAGCPELIEAAAAVLLSLSIEGTIHFKNIRGYVECLFFFFYTEENTYSFVSGQYEKTEICKSTCCGCLLKKKLFDVLYLNFLLKLMFLLSLFQ